MDRKVLVTGAGGFIGSHLTESLVESGYNVKAFVRYNSRNCWGWLEESRHKSEIEIVSGDIRDLDSVKNALKGCDSVFHLAALVGIPYSYLSPMAYIRTNIDGTTNVLQAALESKLNDVLITSTSETYGSAQYVPVDEKHPVVGQSPYSATKIAADQLAVSYHRSFGLPVKIVRPFNTYGPRQSARAVIPSIITQILSGAKIVKSGNVHPTRDFTFVKDTADAFIKIFESDRATGETVNVGTSKEISIKDLAQRIIELTGSSVELGFDKDRVRPEKSEVSRLCCDNSKLNKITGWSPKYSLKTGLIETINWIKQNLLKYKPKLYNV
jgi:NAD dependent epimerase/dehydratase